MFQAIIKKKNRLQKQSQVIFHLSKIGHKYGHKQGRKKLRSNFDCKLIDSNQSQNRSHERCSRNYSHKPISISHCETRVEISLKNS